MHLRIYSIYRAAISAVVSRVELELKIDVFIECGRKT